MDMHAGAQTYFASQDKEDERLLREGYTERATVTFSKPNMALWDRERLCVGSRGG